jgi:hypothetical protein
VQDQGSGRDPIHSTQGVGKDALRASDSIASTVPCSLSLGLGVLVVAENSANLLICANDVFLQQTHNAPDYFKEADNSFSESQLKRMDITST